MRLERRATEKHFLHCQNSRKVFPIMDKILVCTVIAERLNTVPSKMVNIHVLFFKEYRRIRICFRGKKSILLFGNWVFPQICCQYCTTYVLRVLSALFIFARSIEYTNYICLSFFFPTLQNSTRSHVWRPSRIEMFIVQRPP